MNTTEYLHDAAEALDRAMLDLMKAYYYASESDDSTKQSRISDMIGQCSELKELSSYEANR